MIDVEQGRSAVTKSTAAATCLSFDSAHFEKLNLVKYFLSWQLYSKCFVMPRGLLLIISLTITLNIQHNIVLNVQLPKPKSTAVHQKIHLYRCYGTVNAGDLFYLDFVYSIHLLFNLYFVSMTPFNNPHHPQAVGKDKFWQKFALIKYLKDYMLHTCRHCGTVHQFFHGITNVIVSFSKSAFYNCTVKVCFDCVSLVEPWWSFPTRKNNSCLVCNS